MADLAKVMADLYALEINSGLSSFWDDGFTAWVGDDLNGRTEQRFRADELSAVADWLKQEVGLTSKPRMGA